PRAGVRLPLALRILLEQPVEGALCRPVISGARRRIDEETGQVVEGTRVPGIPLGLGGNARVDLPGGERPPLSEQIVGVGQGERRRSRRAARVGRGAEPAGRTTPRAEGTQRAHEDEASQWAGG